jgi:TRAP-type C4-dicarboxylate transport system permease small subunit
LLTRIFDWIIRVSAVIAGLILLFITFSIGYTIATRTLGFQSPVWTVQFNEYSLLWMTFLGTAWVLSRRKHVAIDIVMALLNPAGQRVMEIVHSIMGAGLCAVLCYYSMTIVLNMYSRGVTDVQAVDVPKYAVLFVIPFGFFCLTIQFIRNLVAEVGKGRSQEASSPDLSSRV